MAHQQTAMESVLCPVLYRNRTTAARHGHKCVFYMPTNFQDRPLSEQGIDEADVEDMITELTEDMNEAFIDVVKIDCSKGYDIAVGRRINRLDARDAAKNPNRVKGSMNPYAKLNADQDRDAGAKYHQGQADPARDMSDFMANK